MHCANIVEQSFYVYFNIAAELILVLKRHHLGLLKLKHRSAR